MQNYFTHSSSAEMTILKSYYWLNPGLAPHTDISNTHSWFIYTVSSQTFSLLLLLWITLTVFKRCPRCCLHHLTVKTAEASCNICAFASVTDTSTCFALCRQLHILSWLVPRHPASSAECNSVINNGCREMDHELRDCLRTATLIKVFHIVCTASAFVQSQHQPADSLHSLCVYAVSMNLFIHIYKCGNVNTCQKVWRTSFPLIHLSNIFYLIRQQNPLNWSSRCEAGLLYSQLTLQTWDRSCTKMSYCFCLLGLQNMLIEVAFYCALQKKITAIYHQFSIKYLKFFNSCCALSGEMVATSAPPI